MTANTPYANHGLIRNRQWNAQFALLALLALIASYTLITHLLALPGLTADDALNTTYPSEWTASGSFTLSDGSFVREPYEEGAA